MSSLIPPSHRIAYVGIFQNAGFVGDVHEIGVDAPGGFLGHGKRNSVLKRVIEQILTTLESTIKLGKTPRRNDSDLWMEGVSAQFEPDLMMPRGRKRRERGDDPRDSNRNKEEIYLQSGYPNGCKEVREKKRYKESIKNNYLVLNTLSRA